MSDLEEKSENTGAQTEANAATDDSSSTPQPKRSKKKKRIILGVVVAVIVVGGFGFWNWHNQPSFCSAICHDPMDPYLPTYEAETGQPAVDKWGNEVPGGSDMLASYHRTNAGATCMSCHIPTLDEQVSEAKDWVSDDFYTPLDERTTDDLTAARNVDEDQFCLNSSCHNMTRDDLEQLTSDLPFNPHTPQHGEQACSTCHKAHRQSVMMCTQCHTEAEVPDGWVSAAEGKQLAEEQGLTQHSLRGI